MKCIKKKCFHFVETHCPYGYQVYNDYEAICPLEDMIEDAERELEWLKNSKELRDNCSD